MDFFSKYKIVDIVIVLLLVGGGIDGLISGLSREIMKFVNTLIALLVGCLTYVKVGDLIVEKTRLDGPPIYALSFLLSMCAALLVVRLILWLVRNLVDFQFRPFVERFFGFVAGGVRMLIFICAVVLMLTLWDNERVNRHVVEPSRLVQPLSRAMMPVYDRIKSKFPDWNRLRRVEEEKGKAGRDAGDPPPPSPPRNPPAPSTGA